MKHNFHTVFYLSNWCTIRLL